MNREVVEKSPPRVQHIPMGTLLAGSQAGTPGRDPTTENTPHKVELGPFRIDSDIWKIKATSEEPLAVTKAEATRLCATQSQGGQPGRLCTDAEWERACKGAANTDFPGGSTPCPSASCLSDFGVLSLGLHREWTASQFTKNSAYNGEDIIRGSRPQLPDSERRCARRQTAGDRETSKLGFRCCYGPPNAALLTEPQQGLAYEETDLDLDSLKALLESDPKTRPLSQDLELFQAETVQTVFERGTRETKGFTLTHHPVFWRPATGLRLLVVAARSGKSTSFVAAWYANEDTRRLAATFIMENEKGPIVLAYAPSIRPRMHFSSCWGCAGETGKLLLRPPEEIVMLQP
ncbi:MAG: formylglycine-generating enzyme family protein [Polyangiaceae bacterium]|nr:formylglycine-generating enzyme family protein [Polyangiaceae bacterium]